ncbi:hypothetical protein [Synechococcus sp. WC10meta]|uniref:hypothetical protein n=1 Tax=Synechococcus sp. WC10meta TaxID=2964537 RepID=UPI0039C0E6E1
MGRLQRLSSNACQRLARRAAPQPIIRRQVTYQVAGRDFFVISGYEPDGQRIFYLKKLVRPSLQAGFEFVYPANRRERYDRDVEAISRSPSLVDP